MTIHRSAVWLGFIPSAVERDRPGRSPDIMRALETEVVDGVSSAIGPAVV